MNRANRVSRGPGPHPQHEPHEPKGPISVPERTPRITRNRPFRSLLAALALGGCAAVPGPGVDVEGMPLGAFLDDLKMQMREVHWHVRGNVHGCGSEDTREVDLRDGQVQLSLERVAQTDVGGSVKLVAVPLGALAVAPSLGADATRKSAQTLTVKLAVTGTTAAVDIDHAPPAHGPVAQALNAAIDGFIRSDNAAPCLQMTALKLELVVDVARSAEGGFKVVVPAVGFQAGRSDRAVNTLTLDWERIASNRLH